MREDFSAVCRESRTKGWSVCRESLTRRPVFLDLDHTGKGVKGPGSEGTGGKQKGARLGFLGSRLGFLGFLIQDLTPGFMALQGKRGCYNLCHGKCDFR